MILTFNHGDRVRYIPANELGTVTLATEEKVWVVFDNFIFSSGIDIPIAALEGTSL